ncbi:MAG: TatD family deoxyribonuclease [Planctomycetes bacterium]|nr:TatD family deoxyribonuclease [Planctomycetota bacterium]
MELIDSHAHLDDTVFDAERDAVVSRAAAAGIRAIICIGTTAATSERCLAIAAQQPLVFAAAGIQPNYTAEALAGDWERIVAMASRPRVVGIGETGLDRYWQHADFATQQDYFQRHIELARTLDLPFIVHMRDCDADVLEMLRAARKLGPLRGVMHSFTGTLDTALECLDLGMEISFAGMVTYPKSTELRRIAARIPPDRILLETDSPYLSPHPLRKQRPNEPALLVHTAAVVAEELGMQPDELGLRSVQNTLRLFSRITMAR